MVVRCIPMKHGSVENILEGRMTQTRRFVNYGEAGDFLLVKEAFGITESGSIVYAAGPDDFNGDEVVDWRSGRHMRKGQCRILLQITDKWIEHILDISEEDAIAVSGSMDNFIASARANFGRILVDSNPLITAYRFNVITLREGLQAFEAARGLTLGPGPAPGENPSEGPLQGAVFGGSRLTAAQPVAPAAMTWPEGDM